MAELIGTPRSPGAPAAGPNSADADSATQRLSESAKEEKPRELPRSSPAFRHSCQILVVDDDIGIRASVGALLEEEGYQVEEAVNGLDALERLERAPPTLVLLDMRMPIMDGWEFAERLRLGNFEVPIVVMSAARDAGTWAGEIGAAAHIDKPFDPDALVALVDDICAGRA